MPLKSSESVLAARAAARRSMQLIERSNEILERSYRTLNQSDRLIWEAEIRRNDSTKEQEPVSAD